MAAIADKRQKNRVIMDDSFNIQHRDHMCRVVDISPTGIGVTYIGENDWPEKVTFEYSLRAEASSERSISCRTVWETTMDFYKARSDEKVKRRGLQFIDPDSSAVMELHRHLKKIAESN